MSHFQTAYAPVWSFGYGYDAVGNRGFARFVRVAKGSVTVDEAAIQRDALLDGLFVLTTNRVEPAAEIAQTYKSLWRGRWSWVGVATGCGRTSAALPVTSSLPPASARHPP